MLLTSHHNIRHEFPPWVARRMLTPFCWKELITLKTFTAQFKESVCGMFVFLRLLWALWNNSHVWVCHAICKTVFPGKKLCLLFSFSPWKTMSQWPRRMCRGFWSSATNRGEMRHHTVCVCLLSVPVVKCLWRWMPCLCMQNKSISEYKQTVTFCFRKSWQCGLRIYQSHQ